MTGRAVTTAAGAFEIGAPISHSQSSEVYAATERATGARCVVKTYAEAAQATREARALSALDGGPAPQLLSRLTLGGAPALAMERLEGLTLEDWAGSAPETERAERLGAILSGLCAALSEVHAKVLVHADLKPDHVFLCDDGRVRLLDFASSASAGERASASDARWLSPGFSAPECDPNRAGDQPLGPWSDYFSVGGILFWLAEGRAPAAADLDRPAEGAEGLAEAARKLLRREPSDRPLNQTEFRAVIGAAAGPAPRLEAPALSAPPRDPVPPTEKVRKRLPGRLPDPPPPAKDQPPRSGVGGLALAGGLAALLVVAGAGYGLGWPVYQRLYKTTWVVDPGGGGDALSLAEALERAGPDVRMLLAAGEHPAAPIVGRSVAIAPVEGLAEPPVIIGGAEPCLRLSGARFHLSGVKIARAGDAATGGCLEAQGGEVVLNAVALERARGPGLMAREGAQLRLAGVEISNPQGTGLMLGSGVRASLDGVVIGGAGAAGLVAGGGAEVAGESVKIIAPKTAGVAAGGGARVALAASEVDGAGATGVELTEGAEATLTDMLIDSVGGAGVALYDGARLTMQGGTIAHPALTGIFADGAGALDVSGAKVLEGGEHGALLRGLKAGRIANAEISGNGGIGLGVFPGVEVELTNNRIEGNKGGDVVDARAPERAEPTPGDAPEAPAR